MVGLIFIGLMQFASSVFGVATSILFFYFGDTVLKRKQSLILSITYVSMIVTSIVTLIITQIIWMVRGMPGQGGAFALSLLLLFHMITTCVIAGAMSWRIFVNLRV
jgi:hypothetical protein